MTAPDLALQIAIHDRLIAAPALTALVPADHIRDGSTRPDKFPTVILGYAQTVLEGVSVRTRTTRVFLDIHVWTAEHGMMEAREIANEVRNALLVAPDVPGFDVLGNFWVTGTRTVRDPQDYGHVVVSVEALMTELF